MEDSGRPSPSVVKTSLERQGVKVEVVDQVSSDQPVALPLPMAQGRLRPQLPSDASHLGLRVTNVSQGRILVVVSINGLDPRTGQKAYQGQPGYVLLPGQAWVLKQGKLKKKGPLSPILATGKPQGNISIAVFPERTDYPLLLPGMTPPPFGPENYRVGSDGVRRWVPPARYPFRKEKAEPSDFLYMDYEHIPPSSSNSASL